MKLATLKDGTRDGQLVVVSRDLHTAVIADAIAPTLQRVIEDWSFYAPQLRALYEALNTGRARRAFGFEARDCMAPLPRAYRMIAHAAPALASDAGAAASLPPMTLAARRADALLGAHDDVVIDPAARGPTPASAMGATVGSTAASAAGATTDAMSGPVSGPACEVGFAAILGDVPAGSAPARAADRIHLLMLASAFTMPADAASGGAGRLPHHAYCAFSPVAATPDEFGAAWQGVRLTMHPDIHLNGRRVAPRAGEDASRASADFSRLAAALARTQDVVAGTLLLGALQPVTAPASTAADARAAPPGPQGLEIGDRIRVDGTDAAHAPVCGAIELSIVAADDSA